VAKNIQLAHPVKTPAMMARERKRTLSRVAIRIQKVAIFGRRHIGSKAATRFARVSQEQ
jgi:hypothetical protein